jgi:hypothetical protein
MCRAFFYRETLKSLFSNLHILKFVEDPFTSDRKYLNRIEKV